MRKPTSQSPLTESQYQLVAARERHRPLTLKERRAADELIRTSPAAAKYGEALRGRLKEVATERLQVILGGTGSESASAAPAKGRKTALKILFADGLNTVTAGPPHLEFNMLRHKLRFLLLPGTHGDKRLGREVELIPLDYLNKLGARRDAIAASDLLVIDATSFIATGAERESSATRFAAKARTVNALYEVAWAIYLCRPMVWFLPEKYDMLENPDWSRAVRGRIPHQLNDLLNSLAFHHSMPLFKMQRPNLEARFMPQDYRSLFKNIQAPFVVGVDAALVQILQAALNVDSSGVKGKERAVELAQKTTRLRTR